MAGLILGYFGTACALIIGALLIYLMVVLHNNPYHTALGWKYAAPAGIEVWPPGAVERSPDGPRQHVRHRAEGPYLAPLTFRA